MRYIIILDISSNYDERTMNINDKMLLKIRKIRIKEIDNDM